MTFQSQCKLLNHTNWYRKQKFGAYHPKGWWNSSLWWLLSILKIMSTKANNKFQLFTFGSQNIIEGLNGVMVFVARGKIPLPQNPLSRLLVVDVRFYKVGELSLGWCFRISTSFSWGVFGHVVCLDQSRVSKYIWWIHYYHYYYNYYYYR